MIAKLATVVCMLAMLLSVLVEAGSIFRVSAREALSRAASAQAPVGPQRAVTDRDDAP